MTVPPGYLGASDVKDVGIILAHGHDADGWRGKLLTEIAAELGKAGGRGTGLGGRPQGPAR